MAFKYLILIFVWLFSLGTIALQLQITKVELLKLLQKFPETQDVFFTLSNVDIIIEGDVKTSVKIAYGIYTTKSTASVDELRLDLLL